MDKIEKKLLLRDLCARLPYGVRARFCDGVKEEIDDVWDIDMFSGAINADYIIDDVKPYLRPMSSMTEEEKKVVCSMNMISDTELNDRLNYQRMYVQNYTIETFDLFNEHHLDYRGLIPMGLALEAPKNMYKTE